MISYQDINIAENELLKNWTTFKIGGPAKFFVTVKNIDELHQALSWARTRGLPYYILSGGSNILVSDRGFAGLVVCLANLGKEVLGRNDVLIEIKVAGGEVWDEVVAWTVQNSWWGIENLSAIPGKTGALVVQNAGAYGQDISQVINSVEVYEIETGATCLLSRDFCEFGYRCSVFNTKSKGKYVVVNVILTLSKIGEPNIAYPDVLKYFRDKNIGTPGIAQVRESITEIRKNKLPDWQQFGSAGSFFKNFILAEQEFHDLQAKVAANFNQDIALKLLDVKNKFPQPNGIKVPAAFILDICGLKGLTFGGAKVYEKQPLILVNATGEAKAADVLSLFKKICQIVYRQTGLRLQPEPEIIGFAREELEEYFKLE